MKKYFSLVLLLCVLICSQAEKRNSLSKKTNNDTKMLAVSEFIKDNNSSKQFGSINYDSGSNALRIKRIKEFLILILNLLGFDMTTADQKIRSSEVTLLKDAMKACDNVAKGDFKTVEVLRDIIETIIGSKIEKESMDKAVEFIKRKISPNSSLSTSTKKRKDTENKKSLRKANKRISEDEDLNERDVLPSRKGKKELEEARIDEFDDISNEIKNDEFENTGKNSIKRPIKRKNTKNSYAFMTEEEVKDKLAEKNTSTSESSKSKDSKEIEKLLLKVEKLEGELEKMATQQSVENMIGKITSSIESQSKTLSDNLEKQSAQSKDSTKDLKNQIELLKGNCKIFAGQTSPSDWKYYSSAGIVVKVDISSLALKNRPIIISSIHGNSGNWETTGGSSVYPSSDNKSFAVYVRYSNSGALTIKNAQDNGWYISYIVCY